MLQIWNALPAKAKKRILCSYSNTTEKAQIIRVSNVSNWYERVVFPDEGFLFETSSEAWLEIHSAVTPTAILIDKIPCSQLAIGLAPN